MLGKLLTPLTTARPIGTILRDVVVALGSIIAILGIFGVLTPEQVRSLQQQIEALSGQMPAILAAFGVLIGAGMSIYRALFKSSSDKAADVAKVVDAELPPEQAVVIKTPPGQSDIVVPAKP